MLGVLSGHSGKIVIADTERLFNNDFLQSLDCDVKASDNFKSRQYTVRHPTMDPQSSQKFILPDLIKSFKVAKVDNTQWCVVTFGIIIVCRLTILQFPRAR